MMTRCLRVEAEKKNGKRKIDKRPELGKGERESFLFLFLVESNSK
jgi:hypothetical protein